MSAIIRPGDRVRIHIPPFVYAADSPYQAANERTGTVTRLASGNPTAGCWVRVDDAKLHNALGELILPFTDITKENVAA